MRLADTVAHRRMRYPRPIPTMPDICVVDVPPVHASASLALARYYPVIIETDLEWQEWDGFLHADRTAPTAPDLLDRRPSALNTVAITFAHYDPPATGWPWILLCRWPSDHVSFAGDQSDLFARSAYTMEVAPDPAIRAKTQAELLRALDRHRSLDIVFVPPSTIIGTG